MVVQTLGGMHYHVGECRATHQIITSTPPANAGINEQAGQVGVGLDLRHPQNLSCPLRVQTRLQESVNPVYQKSVLVSGLDGVGGHELEGDPEHIATKAPVELYVGRSQGFFDRHQAWFSGGEHNGEISIGGEFEQLYWAPTARARFQTSVCFDKGCGSAFQ